MINSSRSPPLSSYKTPNSSRSPHLSSYKTPNSSPFNRTKKMISKEIKDKAGKKINKAYIKSYTHLSKTCKSFFECLTFGKHIDKINSYFEGFINFELVDSIRSLGGGENSVNGFVREIEYEKNGLKAYAVLKSSNSETTDNLYYEYLVGDKFINGIIKKFPCFLQTYGFYFYEQTDDYYHMKADKKGFQKEKKNILMNLVNKISYRNACKFSKYGTVLIQHIHFSNVLNSFIDVDSNNFNKQRATNFRNNDCIYMLFIIYQALASLSKQFTHYDLHTENVLVVQLDPRKYYCYKYHLLDGSIIEFKTSYIVKIIDYGHCFFDNGNTNSQKIYEKICETEDCLPHFQKNIQNGCGAEVGFNWFDDPGKYGICSRKKNESHDLRLLYLLKILWFDKTNELNPTTHVLNELKTMVDKVICDDVYGTEENLAHHPDLSSIANVSDAYKYLKDIVQKQDVINHNESVYAGLELIIGTFDIYEDQRNMKIDIDTSSFIGDETHISDVYHPTIKSNKSLKKSPNKSPNKSNNCVIM